MSDTHLQATHLALTRRLVGIAGLACALLSTPSFAQEPKEEFAIKERVPRTGSSIRRDATSGSRLPINKRYEELSPEARAELHGYYEAIAPGDEPPFPARGLKPIHDAIQRAQMKLRVRGELILLAHVDAQGEVTEVKALGSPSPEMTEFAASVLFITRFKPAKCGGQPCGMDFPFRFVFSVARL